MLDNRLKNVVTKKGDYWQWVLPMPGNETKTVKIKGDPNAILARADALNGQPVKESEIMWGVENRFDPRPLLQRIQEDATRQVKRAEDGPKRESNMYDRLRAEHADRMQKPLSTREWIDEQYREKAESFEDVEAEKAEALAKMQAIESSPRVAAASERLILSVITSTVNVPELNRSRKLFDLAEQGDFAGFDSIMADIKADQDARLQAKQVEQLEAITKLQSEFDQLGATEFAMGDETPVVLEPEISEPTININADDSANTNEVNTNESV